MKARQEPLAFAACGSALLVGLLLPMLFPALELLRSGAPGLGRAALLLSSWGVWQLLLRSVALAGAVTAGTLLVGIPLAVLLFRTDVHAPRTLLALHAFPMFLPPFLLALGWFHLFGRKGYVGTELTSSMLFSPAGAVLVLSATFAPIVTVLIGLALVHIDPSIDEAARTVAVPSRVVRCILLPLARPGALLAGLVVFSLALSEMAVPMFLRVRVYPGAVFARLGGIDYAPGEAFALVIPLAAVSLIVVAGERWLRRRTSFASLGPRTGEVWRAPLGVWRWPVSVACWALVLLSLAPLVALGTCAWSGSGFREIPRWIDAGLRNSLLPAVIAATAITALALVIGRAIVRERPLSGFFDSLAVVSFVTPAAVVGVGLIALWNRPATAAIYHGTLIVVLGYVARYSVIAIRTVTVALAQSSPNLEDAATASGASFLRRLLRIVLPMHIRGIATAWLISLLFCLRDLEMVVLFYPPGLEPLPVRIFTLEANGPEPVVAALALVHAGLTALALLVAATFSMGRAR